ncbi:sulfatase-like hydrolase/transferase [Gordonia sp. HNM0687]|uniref:Sulfatase-like hydrolase/transferase n=1 Tax=Gordonia mangrovi TaxID=2665643 RepID=A0A6L7GN65_9ACTN|nr:sulfatase [Gordonia mangrovi]MXP21350.1 sulfatase-like hydrolase/transferase [Gordonia mangrovi]UVF80100.1 sulfatase [Gordonia mangrovi]
MSTSQSLGASSSDARSGETPRENVLVIHWHDLGRHLGCYGVRGVPSPNLDALAANGIRFKAAHATAPLCSPSRGSLFTGRYPHRNGLIGLAHHGFEYGERVRTLPTLLSEVGYRTVLMGMQHESADATTLGFDVVDDSDTHCDVVVDRARDWLAEHVRVSDERPFFLTAGFFETHRPYPEDRYPPVDPATIVVPDFLPDTDDVRTDLAGLHGAIATADAAVGRLLDTLTDLGLDDTTWIVFFTDHGLAFPRAKSTLYEAGTGIALLMRPPRRRALLPRTYDGLFSGVDLAPTMLDLLSVPIPDAIDGVSHAASMIADSETPVRTEVFTEKTYHDDFDPIRAVRTGEYSYIENYADRPILLLPRDIADSPSARAIDHESARSPRPARELYALAVDPDEHHNLADDPAYAETQRILAETLAQWRSRTDDILPDDTEGAAVAERFGGR